MNAKEHTHAYHYHGGPWHATASIYLGYREEGRWHLYSIIATAKALTLIAWDWVRE